MNNAITVMNHDVQIKNWESQRVVTFKDIDAVHQRPEGTASRNFRTNRERFIEGEDYYKICADEFRLHKMGDISNKAHEDIYLITESGYLMLVKSFTDDLAWKVQRALVNSYFRIKVAITRTRSKPIDIVFRQQLNMAQDFSKVTGVSLSIAVAAGISEAERITGENFDRWKRVFTARTDKKPVPELNPTKLGEIIGISAAQMNHRLEAAGLQVKPEKKWRLTEKGKAYGEEFPFERNGHSDYYILWRREVLDAIKGEAVCAN